MNDFYTYLNMTLATSSYKQKRQSDKQPMNFRKMKQKSNKNLKLMTQHLPIKNSLQSILFKPKLNKHIKLKSDPSCQSLNMQDSLKHQVSVMPKKNNRGHSIYSEKNQKKNAQSVIHDFPTIKIQQIEYPQSIRENHKMNQLLGPGKVRLQKIQTVQEQRFNDTFMNFIQPQIPQQRHTLKNQSKNKGSFHIVQKETSSQTLPPQNDLDLFKEEIQDIYFFPKQSRKKIIHSNLHPPLMFLHQKQIKLQGHHAIGQQVYEEDDNLTQIHPKMI